MITRTSDEDVIRQAVGRYETLDLDLREWAANPANVALVNEEGDVSLFERQWRQPNLVFGHYFFVSRGKEAFEVAQEMLKTVFTGPYDITIVAGLTPVEHKGALRMNKLLGFQEHGQVETPAGVCEFVMLTKEQWENSQ